MFTIFRDTKTRECHVVSTKSIDYPDYLNLKIRGFFEELMTAKKKVCERYIEELDSEMEILD